MKTLAVLTALFLSIVTITCSWVIFDTQNFMDMWLSVFCGSLFSIAVFASYAGVILAVTTEQGNYYWQKNYPDTYNALVYLTLEKATYKNYPEYYEE